MVIFSLSFYPHQSLIRSVLITLYRVKEMKAETTSVNYLKTQNQLMDTCCRELNIWGKIVFG